MMGQSSFGKQTLYAVFEEGEVYSSEIMKIGRKPGANLN